MTPVTKVLLIAAVGAAAGFVLLSKSRDTAPDERQALAQAQRAVALPTMLELGSDKCIPCKAMQPVLSSLRTKHAGKLSVVFVDVWKDTAAADKYGVEAIPTQVFLDSTGKEVYRHQGFYAEADIEAKLDELGFRL